MPTAPRVLPLTPKCAEAPRASTAARGYGTAHQKARKILLARFPTCQRCGQDFSHHMHHRDRDTANRDPSNLEALCERCHQAEHRRR